MISALFHMLLFFLTLYISRYELLWYSVTQAP